LALAHLVLAVTALAARERPAAIGTSSAGSGRAAPPASASPTVAGMHVPSDTALPASSSGTRRYVTEGRYGTIVIDVIGEALFVNGDPVERSAAAKR
jgi:hypothetical protein